MLDAMIACALKKLPNTHVHIRKKSKCRRAMRSKIRPIPVSWQIAYMIYEHFRATRAYEAVQGLSDLFTIRLHNDDVQDFALRWDQAPLSASETPTKNDPGWFMQVKITGFCSASDCIGSV